MSGALRRRLIALEQRTTQTDYAGIFIVFNDKPDEGDATVMAELDRKNVDYLRINIVKPEPE